MGAQELALASGQNGRSSGRGMVGVRGMRPTQQHLFQARVEVSSASVKDLLKAG